MFPRIQKNNFYKTTTVVYPPFKNGYYMEEYFFHYMQKGGYEYDKTGRRYIPALWTNFQIEEDFQREANAMQMALDRFVLENPCDKGYFIVVQHDEGPMLKVPPNTLIYGACTGQAPLPLIYEDNNNRLINLRKERGTNFSQKSKLCSFVGTITHDVRKKVFDEYEKNNKFHIHLQKTWTNDVKPDMQTLFIEETLDSKFVLAPRGNGRSSFRFFEVLQLGSIPVYIWDDKEWLPYKDVLDYDKFCISIHESEIDILDEILLNVNEKKYNSMLNEYEKVKHMFELAYMCEYITGKTNKIDIPVLTKDTILVDVKTHKPQLKKTVAVVIFTIGERHTTIFNRYFKNSVTAYCKRHGYNLILETELIKQEPNMCRKKFLWQKLLCPSKYPEYDYLICLDADIYINKDAPAFPLDEIPMGKVAAVNERKYMGNYEWREEIQLKAGWERTGKDWYKLSGHDADYHDYLNGGLVIYQPKYHAHTIKELYEDHINDYMKYSQDDQSILSIYLMENNKIHWLDERYNCIWFFWKEIFYPGFENLDIGTRKKYVKNYIHHNYFCHFTGGNDIEYI